jgi:putative ubiquitin-RnfH superfamily antitoxin RatB of RatAB toxin-antitoxin module
MHFVIEPRLFMAKVEVVHVPASGEPQRVLVPFASGMCVANALEQSGMLKQFPELAGMPVGIFSKPVSLDTLVKPGDRVEIYRPLTLNPMEKRRLRAKKNQG